MASERDVAQKLVFALRRVVADAEGASLHGGNLEKALEAIKTAVDNAAEDAAKQLGMPPYDKQA